MVVVLIIGILAAVGVPQFTKTVETSRAETAAGITHMIASAIRMMTLDNPGTIINGTFTNCPTTPPPCNPYAAGTNACNLIACNYLTNMSFSSMPYEYLALNSGSGPRMLAMSYRRVTARYPCKAGKPYCSWTYFCYEDGLCTAQNGAPRVPSF
ncbi:MAG TPA: hypothetical protein DCL44_01260 [Elusimicrobia bacterium]|nr:hypothetical protein [Elusimicrobiota bacterium]